MPKFLRYFTTLCLACFSLASPAAQTPSPARKNFTYEQVFTAGERPQGMATESELLAALPDVVGWLNDSVYLENREDPADKKRRLYAVDAASGTARVYRDYAEMNKRLPQGCDSSRPAAESSDHVRYVLDCKDDLYYFNYDTSVVHRLTANPAKEQNPRFSPDGRWVAYTRDGNLFAYDLENLVEHQCTSDGSDTVYNGHASWVYYEEILERASNYAAFWWSPDSTKLAFMRFDDSPVPVFPIYHAGGQHGELERQRYPKAGDPNPYVSMGVVSAAEGKVSWMDFEAKADQYIAWPFWTPDSRTLVVQWMNRGQDTIRLFNCDPTSGKKQQILEQQQTSWVIFFEDLHFLKDDSGFLVRSDIDGWNHLYLYRPDGTLNKQLTVGEWPVDSIETVDETGGYVYFTGHPGKSWDTQLMRVKLDGTGLEQLTRGEGTHRVKISPRGTYFIDTVSAVNTPATMSLCGSDASIMRKLGDARKPALDEYAFGRAELFTIPSGDGFDLPAYWVLPADFDPSHRYPVIFSIYGGPDAGTVQNSWLGLRPHYWAQRGVITVSVDHRGGGQFGKKGTALMHRSLGKWEMADLCAAAGWLRSKPFIASDKIGITGASYGGYATMLALTRGSDCFNFGQAGSSVTDWKLYDSVYTERYMDKPDENPEGYKDGAVLTWIDRYKGLLRITHGDIDDNVHMQNSTQVVERLTNNNKHFELMIYPDSRHGIKGSERQHYSRESHDFWMRNLLGIDPAALRSH
jgi:dipeptidyl-peptidase 4